MNYNPQQTQQTQQTQINVLNNQIQGQDFIRHQQNQDNPFSYPTQSASQGILNDQNINQNEPKLVDSCDLEIRGGFIAKVYSILTVQLFITFLMIVLTYYSKGFQNLIIDLDTGRYTAFSWICFALALIIEIVVFCCRKFTRKVPLNYILLFLFTFSFGILVAAPCALVFYAFSNGVKLTIIAAALTFGITGLLTIYAWQTKTDYSAAGQFCFVIGCSLLLLVIIGIIIHNIWFQLIICCLCVIVYSGYIIYDTQIIIGNHSYYLSIDDYIIGAMILYIDLVILFLRILEILVILFGKN